MTNAPPSTIRSAQPSDREQVSGLWVAASLAPATADQWNALMIGGTTGVLVAEEGGRMVGAVVAASDGWRAYIYHLAVEEGYRRRGIGQRLMGDAEQQLLSTGARHVFVAIHQDNTEGLALAGTMGYLPEGEIVLAKRLATRAE